MSFHDTCGFLRPTVLSFLMSVYINATRNMKFFHEGGIEAAVFTTVSHLMIGTLH